MRSSKTREPAAGEAAGSQNVGVLGSNFDGSDLNQVGQFEQVASPRDIGIRPRCIACGARFQARPLSARYCSDACKKRTSRGGEQIAQYKGIVDRFAALGLIGKQASVHRNDPSPAVHGLMVPRAIALAEHNFHHADATISEAELASTLRFRSILDWGAPLPFGGTKSRVTSDRPGWPICPANRAKSSKKSRLENRDSAKGRSPFSDGRPQCPRGTLTASFDRSGR
jgi:hypothetical protein